MGGTPALRLKHAAARPQVPPDPPGGLGAAPGTQTGKLMQGLVPQRAVPSPHTEYLGITYCEGSNADRSSALGLRLNQQDKNEEKQNTTSERQFSDQMIAQILPDLFKNPDSLKMIIEYSEKNNKKKQ